MPWASRRIRPRLDQPAGDDAVVDRLLAADVEIVEEAVEDGHPLYEPGFDVDPFVRGMILGTRSIGQVRSRPPS